MLSQNRSDVHTRPDTGEPLGMAVIATHTLTMVGLKKGFLNPKARQYLGEIHVVDIGAPGVLLQSMQTMSIQEPCSRRIK